MQKGNYAVTKVNYIAGQPMKVIFTLKAEPTDYIKPKWLEREEYAIKLRKEGRNAEAANYLKHAEPKAFNPALVGTLDIETVVKNGIHIPFLYSFYDGKESFSFMYTAPYDLLRTILQPKYKGYTFFAHNLSRFDSIFLLKHLAELDEQGYKVNMIKKEDKFININITHKKDRKIDFNIKDSLLLLNIGLDKLCKQFNVPVQKTIQPVYVHGPEDGDDYLFYENDSLSHFNKKVEVINIFREYSFKIQKYCENDCKALHGVLLAFGELMQSKFSSNILTFPTIPSLAFNLYKEKYIPINTIPATRGEIFGRIRNSYTGGSTEMYKPEHPKDAPVNCYDVNSLYPTVMDKSLFPCGQIYSYTGNIHLVPEADFPYWIGKANVSNVNNPLYQPYLQMHHKTKGGWRTVAPNGKFDMWIHKPEYENALKDYTFNFSESEGYAFTRCERLFEGYVTNIYAMRQTFPKSDPMNYICKLLMNSLYGRFGMAIPTTETSFMDWTTLEAKLIEGNVKISSQQISETLYFCEQEIDGDDSTHNVNVAIASAVTAYSRIFMSQFKNNANYDLYYTDTDSIFIREHLNNNLEGSALGQLKLEYTFSPPEGGGVVYS